MNLDDLIGVVGPCAAGKTTLIKSLSNLGITAKHIAQEHSLIPDMWKRLSNPDLLIFLDVSYSNTLSRRHLQWSLEEFNKEHKRLSHAKDHCDLYINTDNMSIDDVLDVVLMYLDEG